MVSMIDPNEHRLQEVNNESLTPFVQKALDRPAMVTSWNYEPMPGGFGGGRGGTFIYRFSGTAHDQGQKLDWSMILKIIQHRPNEDPADPKYWKREYEFYKSGFFNHLPGGLTAARCYGVSEFEGEACWLWLEELHDDLGETWPLEHYRVIGQHAGHFSGAFLIQPALPVEPWLSTQWLHKTIATVTSELPQLPDFVDIPFLKPVLPPDARAQFARLQADCDSFLAALENLPQTIAHLDYFRRNVFALHSANGDYKTVAVDWAFVGQTAIGAEAATPVLIGLFGANIDPERTDKHEKLVYDGYLAGLRDMGWNGDPRMVRLGYAATTALKFIELMAPVCFLADPDFQATITSALGCPISQYIHHVGAMNRLAYRMADEARTLINEL